MTKLSRSTKSLLSNRQECQKPFAQDKHIYSSQKGQLTLFRLVYMIMEAAEVALASSERRIPEAVILIDSSILSR